MKKIFLLVLISLSFITNTLASLRLVCWVKTDGIHQCNHPLVVFNQNCSEKRILALEDLGISIDDIEFTDMAITLDVYDENSTFSLGRSFDLVSANFELHGMKYLIKSATIIDLDIEAEAESHKNGLIFNGYGNFDELRDQEIKDFDKLIKYAYNEIERRSNLLNEQNQVFQTDELEKEVFLEILGFDNIPRARREITNRWHSRIVNATRLYSENLVQNNCETKITLIGSTSVLDSVINNDNRNEINKGMFINNNTNETEQAISE